MLAESYWASPGAKGQWGSAGVSKKSTKDRRVVQGNLAVSKGCDVLYAKVGNISPRKLMFFKHVPFCCYWCWRPSGSVSYQALLIWYQNSGIQTISGDWLRGSSAAVFITRIRHSSGANRKQVRCARSHSERFVYLTNSCSRVVFATLTHILLSIRVKVWHLFIQIIAASDRSCEEIRHLYFEDYALIAQ